MKSKYSQAGLAWMMMGVVKATVLLGDGANLGSGNIVGPGSNSIAAGASNEAVGNSAAIGFYNYASTGSLAVGESSTVYGDSFAVGSYNLIDISSFESMASGEGNELSGSVGSAALGCYNMMGNQTGSMILGYGNSIKFSSGKFGYANIVIGENNKIDATVPSASTDLQGTVLLGAGNESSSRMAFALGLCNIAQSEAVSIGTYAQTAAGASLIVGNGISSSARNNGLVVLKNGEVQIPGSLVVGGSPTLTQGSAASFLSSNGYLKKASGISASVGTGGLLAIGDGATAIGQFSVALGKDSHASSSGAVALGNGSIASGVESTAMGSHSTAAGYSSTAMGYSIASSDYSSAMGNSQASGEGSTATGASMGSGDYSTATGISTATGSFSMAMGNSISSGENSTATGVSTASGDYSTAMGVSTASGICSTAVGYAANATSFVSASFGRYNKVWGSGNSWIEDDPLFLIGNGSGSGIQASNALAIRKNGQTTLTNKEWKANIVIHPTQALADPAATTASSGEALVVEGHTRLKGKVIIEQAQGDISMGDYQ